MVDQDEEDLQPDQQCWRPGDLEKMLRDGDKVSISKYCRFGLVHDKYARLRGLQVFSSHQEEYLPNRPVSWRVISSRTPKALVCTPQLLHLTPL